MNNMIVLTVALPLLTAFLIPIIGRVSHFVAALLGPAVLIALAYLVANIWLDMQMAGQAVNVLAIGNFAPPMGIVFYVDQLALLFAFAIPVVTLVLWPWFAESNEAYDSRLRKYSLTLLLAAAMSGLALSGDLFNLYVFYELAAVASYGLAAGRGNNAGYAAAFRYMMISAMGSVMALLGIGLIYFVTGTLNLAHLSTMQVVLDSPVGLSAFVLMLLGFGVKAELSPLNSWVPEVYMAASRRVAGLMAGLVSKLAVLIIVKTLVLMYPQEEARWLLLLLGTLTVLVGEFSALRAKDMVRLLSWSSIGQLGLVFVAFSISGKAGLLAGLAVTLHHLVAKPALFLIAERWGGNLLQLEGVARSAPLMGGLFVFIALSLVGVPPFPGFWAKFLLLSGLAAEATTMALTAIAVVLIMTVIEANYLFRVITVLYDGDKSENKPLPFRFADSFAALGFGLVLLVSTLFIQTVGLGLDAIAEQTMDTELYIQQTLLPEARP